MNTIDSAVVAAIANPSEKPVSTGYHFLTLTEIATYQDYLDTSFSKELKGSASHSFWSSHATSPTH